MAASNDYGEYIDYESFLSPDFSPSAFANTLVLATNNPSDIPLDLSTPLSRVLFDTQEIDSHIDHLTTKSAVPLLAHTRSQTAASTRIVAELDTQIESLNGSFKQLEREVIQKHAEADHLRQVATRLWLSLRLGRSVSRCLQLGRQLEIQLAEAYPPSSTGASKLEDHRALIRCAHTINSISEILDKNGPGEEGYGVDRVTAIQTLRDRVLSPARLSTREASETIIRNFLTPPPNASGALPDPENAHSRVVSAITVLCLLSPTSTGKDPWVPRLLQEGIEVNLRASLQASISTLGRALGQLPLLDRALSEVSARCRTVVVLEHILKTTKPPSHPSLVQLRNQDKHDDNLLRSILEYLETGSLVSYFWRTLASSLSSRVQELVSRGGVAARTLRTNKGAVSDALRNCVIEGCRADTQVKNVTSIGNEGKHGGWEREIAVMTSSVVGALGR